MNEGRRNFIRVTAAGTIAFVLLPGFKEVPDSDAAKSLPRATPESQGVSSVDISRFLTEANASGISWHSFMMLRYGKVIAEGWWKPFAPQFKHSLYSISKSFTSMAIGLLVKEKKLDLNAPVISFFPEYASANTSAFAKQMKVVDLLTMNTGHPGDSMPAFFQTTNPWVQTFLEQPIATEPGTHFMYNTAATYMLGAILYKVTGQTLEEWLTPRLFKPLQIEGYDWEKSPQGLNTAGYGLRVKTEDLAKFGQLLLQQGNWNGKNIVPENWVKRATTVETPSYMDNGVDWTQGYGYQFWRGRHGTFRADGRYGQYCIVLPEQQGVIAITGEIPSMQKPLDMIWDILLPAYKKETLKKNPEAHATLQQQLKQLAIAVTKVVSHSPLAGNVDGKIVELSPNDFNIQTLQFQFTAEGINLTTVKSGSSQVMRFGWQDWVLNDKYQPYPFPSAWLFQVPSLVCGTATWTDEHTLLLETRLVESMQGDKIICTFKEGNVTVSFQNSIGEKTKGYDDAPEKRTPLQGKIKE